MTEVPEGKMEVWTIERPDAAGLLIDDLRATEAEAIEEVTRRGHPWRAVRLLVDRAPQAGNNLEI